MSENIYVSVKWAPCKIMVQKGILEYSKEMYITRIIKITAFGCVNYVIASDFLLSIGYQCVQNLYA